MFITSTKAQNFGERSALGRVINPKTTKRSLIDDRLLPQDKILDDVYEFCKQQKENSKPLHFSKKEKHDILKSQNPVEALIDYINSKTIK